MSTFNISSYSFPSLVYSDDSIAVIPSATAELFTQNFDFNFTLDNSKTFFLLHLNYA